MSMMMMMMMMTAVLASFYWHLLVVARVVETRMTGGGGGGAVVDGVVRLCPTIAPTPHIHAPQLHASSAPPPIQCDQPCRRNRATNCLTGAVLHHTATDGSATTSALSTVGRRAFAVHGPMVWNSLPDDLRAQQDYQSFRQGLKTWLFSR